jgi:transcriptional regulator with XRE-family HTH domain
MRSAEVLDDRRRMDQVAERLAELRERRALTLRELGEMSGVAADTINQIELGHRKARPSTLRKLARALDVEVADFFKEPVPLGEALRETGPASLEEGRLEADSPTDPQQWERVLASVHERQSEVAAKADELVEASAHSEVDPYEVQRVLDEVEDCEITFLLALPGSQRQGRNQITINLSLVAPEQWDEFRNVSHVSEDIGKRLAEAGLVELKERAGQKAEPVPVGIGA